MKSTLTSLHEDMYDILTILTSPDNILYITVFHGHYDNDIVYFDITVLVPFVIRIIQVIIIMLYGTKINVILLIGNMDHNDSKDEND